MTDGGRHADATRLFGLTNVNVELTNRCNKTCWMCGRRRVEQEYPDLALSYGDMDFALVEKIAAQLPPDITVQLHNNGEALLYPRFGDAVRQFDRQITNIVSNGKLLMEKADEIIGLLDTLAVSVFEDDPEADEQFEILKAFLARKGDEKPYTVLRINGDVDTARYEALGLRMAKRAIHAAMGSYHYRRAEPVMPEIGICWDFLHHLAISREGEVSICVRFDPMRLGVLGNAGTESLEALWNGPKRQAWMDLHRCGRRDEVPLCSYCQFWGVPTGPVPNVKREEPDDD